MLPVRWLALGLLLGVIASSTTSCGGAPKCSSSSCPFGCCDASGTCQMTSSDAQCGTNGAACTLCQLGTSCRLGQCASLSSGGGFGGSGGGSSSGGGGGATGGGGGATGGGGGATGGGGGATGGGGGSTGDTLCNQLGVAQAAFFGTRSTCPFVLQGTSTTVTLNANSNLTSQCNLAIASCTGDDRALLATLATCLGSAPPCTAGNENTAGNAYFACVGDVTGLSSACQAAIAPGGTGGGGGSTGGGGGSSVGGGGGSTGGGGGSTSCRSISGLTFDPFADYAAGATFESTYGQIQTSGTTTDLLSMEVVWVDTTPTNVVVPQTFDLAQQGSYDTCTLCVLLSAGCDASGSNCTQYYFAQSGSAAVTQASRATSGTFQGSVSNVRAVEWDFGIDQPLSGGGCVLIPNASISTSF